MNFIIRPRGFGKTTDLIRLAAQNDYYMVVHTQYEADRVFKQAKTMGLTIPFPITYDNFLEKRYAGSNIKGLVIDNADLLLQHLAIAPVEIVSASANNF